MIKILASKNFMGYCAHAMFDWCNNAEIEVIYLDKLDWTQLGTYISPEDEGIFIIGLPYFRSYSFPWTSVKQNQFVTHLASFGDEIKGSGNAPVLSIVSLTESPLLTLRNILLDHDETWNKGLLEDLAVAHNEYHTYVFDDATDHVPLDLMLLSNFFGEHLYLSAAPNNIHDLLIKQQYTLMALRSNLNTYLIKREGQARMATVTYGAKFYNVALIYAEENQNELAHHLMKRYSGFSNLVILVGSHTQTNDRFAIRTSGDVDASLIAKVINGGKGKPQAASVFLTNTPTANFELIIQQLETAMSKGML